MTPYSGHTLPERAHRTTLPALTNPSLPTPSLDHLVASVDRAVRSSPTSRGTVRAVARALRGFLGLPGLLSAAQQQPDATAYRQHLLHVADDGAFSLVALVWMPGQATPVHDHLSWCVVGVHEGTEHETRFRLDGDRLVVTGHDVARVGEVAGLLPPGDIHLVRNAGTDVAISLHVYGADLTDTRRSIRRRYDLPVRGGARLP